MNILFLCTGNSCRSILAEAIFNSLAPQGWLAISAGSRPVGRVHPYALALLRQKNVPTAGLVSKSLNHLPVTPDIVISVCSNAAGEACPVYLQSALRAHWGVADPAQAEGSDEEIRAAFENAYDILRRRIEAMLTSPLASNPIELQAKLERIGEEIH